MKVGKIGDFFVEDFGRIGLFMSVVLLTRTRYYNPETGRFLSEDPIGFNSGDYNLYRYVMNRPLMNTDPSGFIIYNSYAGTPPEVYSHFLYRKLHQNQSVRVYIYQDTSISAAGMTTHLGSGDQRIRINPNNNYSRVDLIDTFIHELNHADLNLSFSGVTEENFDTEIVLPGIDQEVNSSCGK